MWDSKAAESLGNECKESRKENPCDRNSNCWEIMKTDKLVENWVLLGEIIFVF